MATVIPFPTGREPTVACQPLTPRGEACAHPIRFERAWQMLSHEDRRWFAAALGRLAAQAIGPDDPPGD